MYRTIPVEVTSDHVVDTLVGWKVMYNVTAEVLEPGPHGLIVRFHAPTFEELVTFMVRTYADDDLRDDTGNSWFNKKYRDFEYLTVTSACHKLHTGGNYDAAAETAISWLHDAGYQMGSKDMLGESVDDTAQTLLMEAILRAPELAKYELTPVRATQSTPPAKFELSAFNLFVGAAFRVDENAVWVVKKVTRFPHTESVLVIARQADNADEEVNTPFVWNYNVEVEVIGAVVNPYDYDDNNWGTRL